MFSSVPTFRELAPRGVSADFVQQFGLAMSKVLAQEPVRNQMRAMGLAPGYMTAAQLGERERAYTAAWAKIIKDKGFAPAN